MLIRRLLLETSHQLRRPPARMLGFHHQNQLLGPSTEALRTVVGGEIRREIMGSERSAIDLARGQLHIRGGKNRVGRRSLDLVGESTEILTRRLKDPNRWVFPSPRFPGRHITRLNNQHDNVCRESGVSFVLYDLRHTFATRMVEAGCDLPAMAAILGHLGLRMVMRDVHPTAQHQKEAMQKYEKMLRPRLNGVGE